MGAVAWIGGPAPSPAVTALLTQCGWSVDAAAAPAKEYDAVVVAGCAFSRGDAISWAGAPRAVLFVPPGDTAAVAEQLGAAPACVAGTVEEVLQVRAPEVCVLGGGSRDGEDKGADGRDPEYWLSLWPRAAASARAQGSCCCCCCSTARRAQFLNEDVLMAGLPTIDRHAATPTLDMFEGCLVGVAIGDAVGLGVEGAAMPACDATRAPLLACCCCTALPLIWCQEFQQ